MRDTEQPFGNKVSSSGKAGTVSNTLNVVEEDGKHRTSEGVRGSPIYTFVIFSLLQDDRGRRQL